MGVALEVSHFAMVALGEPLGEFSAEAGGAAVVKRQSSNPNSRAFTRMTSFIFH